jgi:hypothetical protein
MKKRTNSLTSDRFQKDLTRRADTSGLRMEKEGQQRDSYMRKGMKAIFDAGSAL